MNQDIDFVEIPRPMTHDQYRVKCERILALDREVRQMQTDLAQKQAALTEMEIELNKGA